MGVGVDLCCVGSIRGGVREGGKENGGSKRTFSENAEFAFGDGVGR